MKVILRQISDRFSPKFTPLSLSSKPCATVDAHDFLSAIRKPLDCGRSNLLSGDGLRKNRFAIAASNWMNETMR